KFEDKLLQLYHSARQQLKISSRIQPADLLAARSVNLKLSSSAADLLEIDKTSGVSVRAKTKSKLNAIVMPGKIPDRGGRPTEIEPPPPEMPAWQQRSAGGGHLRGRGAGAAPQSQRQQGRGGGRVQGGWNTSDSVNGGSHWSNQGTTFYPQSQQSHGGYQQHGYSHDNRQPYHGQQQGAAYYQDFYGITGQQQYGSHLNQQGNDGRRGGGRGSRGYDRY
uniref:Uncharacterized protein n=1 Tax=Romanomermis culicivorax TaxID=13658 RepID=A0A915I868_ROMCU